MYKIYKEQAFFCNGKAFDQLLGVEATIQEAKLYIKKLIDEDFLLKHYSIIIKWEN